MASGHEWVTAVELSGDEDAAGVLLRLLNSLLTHCYGWRQCETNEASLRFALRAHDDGAGGDSPLNGTVSLGAVVVFDELCVRARRRNDRSAPSHRHCPLPFVYPIVIHRAPLHRMEHINNSDQIRRVHHKNFAWPLHTKHCARTP